MNTEKLKSDAVRAFESLKKSNCLVMNKKLRLTDTLYRKNNPSETFLESDVSCDFDVCLWTLAITGTVVVGAIVLSRAAHKAAHGMKHLCHARKSR